MWSMKCRMIMLRLQTHTPLVDKDMTHLFKSVLKIEKTLDDQKPKFQDRVPLVIIGPNGENFRFLNGVLVDENNVPTGEKPPRIL